MSSSTREALPDFAPVTRHGGVAVVTMTCPQRRNAFSSRMRAALVERLEHLMYVDADCRVIVLTGAGGTFCAGGDLSEMQERSIVDGRQAFDPARDVVRLLTTGHKPVVAAVEGHAFGAGLSLACATDYIVATPEARFCASFIKAGLLPDTGILWTLPRRVGASKARELMMLAPEVKGGDALGMGLVNQLADKGGALAAALAVAQAMAQQPRSAVAYLRAALGQGSETPDGALRAEVDYRAMLLQERLYQACPPQATKSQV